LWIALLNLAGCDKFRLGWATTFKLRVGRNVNVEPSSRPAVQFSATVAVNASFCSIFVAASASASA
jgi:hypothetical protein